MNNVRQTVSCIVRCYEKYIKECCFYLILHPSRLAPDGRTPVVLWSPGGSYDNSPRISTGGELRTVGVEEQSERRNVRDGEPGAVNRCVGRTAGRT